ncbi:MAG: primosomal protein N' [Bacteroidetes bacterium]|nr:MAG: primosomal protein N' [Bacteroidota bacterium]
MSGKATCASVILPLAVSGTFSYRIPEDLCGRLAPGMRVLVPFGKKKVYTGLLLSLEEDAPDGYSLKAILEQVDETPVVSALQLQLWKWIGNYYMCSPGELMRAALPSGLRPESESRVRSNPGWNDEEALDRQARLLLKLIREEGEVTIGDLQLSGIHGSVHRLLRQLVDQGAVEINEFMPKGAKPKLRSYISLAPAYRSEEAQHALLDKLQRAPKQRALIERLLDLAGTGKETGPVLRKQLSGALPAQSLNALLKKAILVQEDKEEMANAEAEKVQAPARLNQAQHEALEAIRSHFNTKQTVLLHGITSSGKTELYIHLIRDSLEAGRQVLYLLPEIALSTQIIQRIRRVFGAGVGVFHSRYSDAERVHVYRNLLGLTDQPPYDIIIGVRSAIYLPIDRLGLIIIDEEHEYTFKQFDPAPRYNARDTAQVLALFQEANVLLGTATPSFETLYNARQGKYGLVELKERYGKVAPPEMVLADVARATKRKQMLSHFTPEMVAGIRTCLENQEQIILFQNRRGFAHYLLCQDCGHIPKCSRCDVSLTYHRYSGKMECHYCGYQEPVPGSCPSCGATRMQMKGIGTESLEEEIALVFEGIRVGRLDRDVARSVRSYERILNRFASRELDVLIGTQMLSKGLDFGNVGLVGIIDADSMLNFPDFRAFERSYQLISQVSGRAGRRKKQGKVIIQTMDPGHPVIDYIVRQDFEGFYKDQMAERELFSYPPFSRMIRIRFRHRIPSILDGACDRVAASLREIFGMRVYGPQYPPVRKTHNYFIKFIILKIEREASMEKARSLLAGVLGTLDKQEVFRAVRVAVDVDPY